MSNDAATRARFFRALSHPARLSLLRLTWQDALSGEHLARLLNLAPATISHHLAQLSEVGLVSVQQDGHQRLYRADQSRLAVPLESLVRGENAAQALDTTDPYRERVIRTFFRDGKLTRIPAQRKKRDVILHELAGLFEVGEVYPEAKVNELLGAYHPDFFTLRRELVGLGLLEREKGNYWRKAAEPESSR